MSAYEDIQLGKILQILLKNKHWQTIKFLDKSNQIKLQMQNIVPYLSVRFWIYIICYSISSLGQYYRSVVGPPMQELVVDNEQQESERKILNAVLNAFPVLQENISTKEAA